VKLKILPIALAIFATSAAEGKPSRVGVPCIPFDTSVDHLDSHYSTGDIKGAIAKLSKLEKEAQKDDFESKAQYQERVSNIESSLNAGNIAFSAVVGGNNSTHARYNADEQKIEVYLDLDTAFPNDSPTVHVFGVLGNARSSTYQGNYTGSNVYGATANVEVYKGQESGLAFDESDIANLENAKLASVSDRYAAVHLTVISPPDEAKSLISNMGVLFIGNLRAPFAGEFEKTTEATLTNPSENRRAYHFVHFSLRQIWLYNYQTGQIIKKVTLRT
jgi:hypothetical protein